MEDDFVKLAKIVAGNDWGYHLTRGGEDLAILSPVKDWRFAEHPCIEATYSTTPAFDAVRPLFEREIFLIDANDESDEWMDIWDELKSEDLFVESPDGRERFDILWIHFKDDRAWWWPLFKSPETKIPT